MARSPGSWRLTPTVETQLAPTLAKGDVVILDNLAVHKSEKGRHRWSNS